MNSTYELAATCIQCMNRSRRAAAQATTEEDKAYWRQSAATWLVLFWAVVHGTYGEA